MNVKNSYLKKALIIFTLLATAWMQSIYANPQGISFKKESIRERVIHISELGKETGQELTYQSGLPDNEYLPSFTAKTNNMEEWLSRSLENTGFTYRKISSKHYTVIARPKETPVSPVSPPETSKTGTLAGKVVDEHGEGLPGATVKVTGKTVGTATDLNGNFRLSLPAGTYTIEVGYIGYQTQQITQVNIKEGQNTPLDVALDTESTNLGEVVVTATYNKATTGGLLRIQQNTAEVSSVLSSQQISSLPDKNVGEALKRISGVTTNDNRRVVVRGIAERYNVAMLDGVTLPSTDVQTRDFEFNIIPSDLIDNVIVSKSYTPDMSFGFGGGLVQTSTLAVPRENFITVGVGGKYNNISTGKQFLSYQRGKHDFWGFDDGGRNHYPDNLFYFTQDNYDFDNPYDNKLTPEQIAGGAVPITPAMIAEQNKRIRGTERLGTRVYKAAPSQNWSVSLGRAYTLGDKMDNRLGFVASLSFRNEQMIEDILHFDRLGSSFAKFFNKAYDAKTLKENDETTGNNYKYTTTWAALLNAGWERPNHKVTLRNLYSRLFDNSFTRIIGWSDDHNVMLNLPLIKESENPKFMDLLQNKLEGEHKFGNFTFEWNAARNQINNTDLDAVEAKLFPYLPINIPFPDKAEDYDMSMYYYTLNGMSNKANNGSSLNRSKYAYKEVNQSVAAALTYQFNLLKQRQKVKAGYQYLNRHGTYDWTVLPIGAANKGHVIKHSYIPIQNWDFSFNDPYSDAMYTPFGFNMNGYEGGNINHAFYGMLDNRLTAWLRLVWGLRVESYEYIEVKNGAADWQTLQNQSMGGGKKTYYLHPETGEVVSANTDAKNEELRWRYLPSVSFTLTPVKDVNLRGSYAETVVRPGLIENSHFTRYNPQMGIVQMNLGVLSTQIKHYDTKLEWYPAAGEILAVGYFYKYFENPVELYRGIFDSGNSIKLFTANSKWAKVRGWEAELRKNFGFLYPAWGFLNDLYLSANATLQQSEVQAREFLNKEIGKDKYNNEYFIRQEVLMTQKRPLYGQVPVTYNLGLQYDGERLGVNVAYNYQGYKTLATSNNPTLTESERPRDQLDAQLSYRFLKNKNLKVKLNLSNLLDSPVRFYANGTETFKAKEDFEESANPLVYDWSERNEWKFGFSDKYEEGYYEYADPNNKEVKRRIGDVDTFIKRTGVSGSLSVSYTF